jgi:hypothetical protein
MVGLARFSSGHLASSCQAVLKCSAVDLVLQHNSSENRIENRVMLFSLTDGALDAVGDMPPLCSFESVAEDSGAHAVTMEAIMAKTWPATVCGCPVRVGMSSTSETHC